MIRLYVPSSHVNADWMVYSTTARNSGDWTEVLPGNPFNFGDVCSADYRSDKNLVAQTGQMGDRLTYTFLPFIIKNDYALPHTYVYDLGFSEPILNPSARSTGLDAAGNQGGIVQQFSNDASNIDAQFSGGTNFQGFNNNHFGFQVLGVAADSASVWDLQNGFYWIDSDFAFEVSGSRLSMAPEVLAKAFDYTYHIGKAGNTIDVSEDNPGLGWYRPYLFKSTDRQGSSWMKTAGSLSYPPSHDNTLLIERTAVAWGFFYFCCIDNGKFTWDVANASARYEANLQTGGSPSSPNYYYPQYSNDFSVKDHGKWTADELGEGSNPPARSRSLWWGTASQCREARTGWFVAGRRVD